jgi:hypothetical protein
MKLTLSQQLPDTFLGFSTHFEPGDDPTNPGVGCFFTVHFYLFTYLFTCLFPYLFIRRWLIFILSSTARFSSTRRLRPKGPSFFSYPAPRHYL